MNENLIKDLKIAFENFGETQVMPNLEIVECQDFTEFLLTYDIDTDSDIIGTLRTTIALQITTPLDFALLWTTKNSEEEIDDLCYCPQDIRFIALINSIIRSYEEK